MRGASREDHHWDGNRALLHRLVQRDLVEVVHLIELVDAIDSLSARINAPATMLKWLVSRSFDTTVVILDMLLAFVGVDVLIGL